MVEFPITHAPRRVARPKPNEYSLGIDDTDGMGMHDSTDEQLSIRKPSDLPDAVKKRVRESRAGKQSELAETNGEGNEPRDPAVYRVTEASHPCPDCDGTLIRKTGSRGDFLSCNHYPHCRYSEDLPAPRALPTTADLALIEEVHRREEEARERRELERQRAVGE